MTKTFWAGLGIGLAGAAATGLVAHVLGVRDALHLVAVGAGMGLTAGAVVDGRRAFGGFVVGVFTVTAFVAVAMPATEPYGSTDWRAILWVVTAVLVAPAALVGFLVGYGISQEVQEARAARAPRDP